MSTATCSRPMAARAAPRSPAATSPCGSRPRACSGGRARARSAHGSIAAISCGVVDGEVLCDLDYSEDSRAEVDANIVMTGDGGLVEVQATAERTPVSRASLDELLGAPSRRSPPCARRRSRPAAGRCPADRVRLVVATRNPHKLAELEQIVGEDEARLVPLDEGVQLPPETGETFAENALIKARAAHEHSGRPAIADDSGIEAARSGGARRALGALRRRGRERRGEPRAPDARAGVRGRSPGRLRLRDRAHRRRRRRAPVRGSLRGDAGPRAARLGGFGYDPAFVPDDTGPEDSRTMAELSPAEKHAISHRGRAARALARYLTGRREVERR